MQKGKKFLSDLKLHSDYFKWVDEKNRYETWDEAVEDIMNTHLEKYGESIREYSDKALVSMKEKLVLASQRTLQYRNKQIQQHNARLYNCTTTYMARNKSFQEIFYLLLCGCGVGVGVLKPFVKNISNISKRTKGTKTFVVPDTIEGWSDSLGVLMSSYFVDKQPFPEYAGYEIKFDYSEIRPKGAKISGGFKAPGYESLKQSLENIETLVEQWLIKEGSEIRPILCFDIVCHASNAVISGGVRRSAASFIVDPYDEEMKNAKIGNWFQTHPHRARSNNSVLLLRNLTTKEDFENILKVNDGISDLGFVFGNSWFDMFNPCFEILQVPMLWEKEMKLDKIPYSDLESFITKNEHLLGVQGCNLTEINAEKCQTPEKFIRVCKDAAILGTLQAGFTSFPYLGSVSEEIFKKEALLGVSITGWMNNPKLFNPELLKNGALTVIKTNQEVADLIDINHSSRTTCVKPSGNAAVVLGTASGIHPEHSSEYFRVMQLNKETNTAKWLSENMPFLLENSVWSATNTDYVVFVPVENPKNGLYKSDVTGVKHLEKIKLVQENWVNNGTVKELCPYDNINHNVSCTVIIDNMEDVVNYIWDNKKMFTAVSFISNNADREYNQAPFTTVNSMEYIVEKYGKGSLFASGLIVDGLHYFKNNLWLACDSVLDKSIPVTGTREEVLLKKFWLDDAKKFARNYFKGDLKKLVYCLKDVHLIHKWEVINRQMKEVDFGKILDKPTFKDISDYASQSCSGGACEITRV